MRKSRFALMIVTVYSVFSVLAIWTVVWAASSKEALTSWTSLRYPVATPLRTQLLSAQDLLPLATFASAVHSYQLSQLAKAITSSNAAAQTYQPNTNTSASPNTATAPTEAPGTIWACIISHESGGDPTAVNPSSGDGGLYQFNQGTWLANGGGQFASAAQYATPAEQTQIAESTQAADGWSPWVGDGCTPLG